MEKLFLERIKDSKEFTKEEIEIINNHKELYEKCYYLGLIDSIHIKNVEKIEQKRMLEKMDIKKR